MKRIIAVLVLALAVGAGAQQVIGPDGAWREGWPKTLRGEGWATVDATPEQAQAAGYRLVTPQEIADEAAAAQAEAAQAEAQRIGALAQKYGGAIAVLAHYLAAVGWSLPCDSSAVTSDLIGRAMMGALTDDQKEAKANVADLYMLLSAQGVSNPDIAAIWTVINPPEE